MKRKFVLCLFLIMIISPVAFTQNDAVDLEKRLTSIEVTVEQTVQHVSRIDGRLDSLIMWIVGLLAASFISTFALIHQIKTQLSEMNSKFESQLNEMNTKFESQLNEMNTKFGLLQKDFSSLNEKFDNLDKWSDEIEERVDGYERRIGEQLNQIHKALSKQLGMDIDDPLT